MKLGAIPMVRYSRRKIHMEEDDFFVRMESNYRNITAPVSTIHIFNVEDIVVVRVPFQLLFLLWFFISFPAVISIQFPRTIGIDGVLPGDALPQSIQVGVMHQYPISFATKFMEEPNLELVITM